MKNKGEENLSDSAIRYIITFSKGKMEHSDESEVVVEEDYESLVKKVTIYTSEANAKLAKLRIELAKLGKDNNQVVRGLKE